MHQRSSLILRFIIISVIVVVKWSFFPTNSLFTGCPDYCNSVQRFCGVSPNTSGRVFRMHLHLMPQTRESICSCIGPILKQLHWLLVEYCRFFKNCNILVLHISPYWFSCYFRTPLSICSWSYSTRCNYPCSHYLVVSDLRSPLYKSNYLERVI